MIVIGTSGWQYDDWRGRFYPESLRKSDWLGYFAERLPTVEVNNSFYRLPSADAFVRWRTATPPGFIVTVKANRFITHIKRLKDCKDPLALFWERCLGLAEKLGPVLFQLPPRFKVDHDRLRAFCELVPKQMKAAFEFRDRSWENDETYAILDKFGAAFVFAEWPAIDVPDVVCGGWSYVRFHKGSALRPGYTKTKLRRWAERLAEMPSEMTYVYFNNDTGGAALRDAAKMQGALEGLGVPVVGPLHRDAGRKAG